MILPYEEQFFGSIIVDDPHLEYLQEYIAEPECDDMDCTPADDIY